MAACARRLFWHASQTQKHTNVHACVTRSYRNIAGSIPNVTIERHRKSPYNAKPERDEVDRGEDVTLPPNYREVHQDFIPRPQWDRRDRILEQLERNDMYRRRANIDIPEFYPGSIMSVTVADQQAPGKQNRFVGICIDRGGHGLGSYFILRNVIDEQGVEIKYQIYNPVVQKIDIVRLEKRLDDQLYYLRDCALKYSTFPFDMEAVPHPAGLRVPVNNIKVPLNPRPWSERWERADLKGVEDFEISEKLRRKREHPQVKKTWEKHDLMMRYRESVNDEDAEQIIKEVVREKQDIMKERAKKLYAKR